MNSTVDVLIPTYERPAALAITLTSLFAQTFRSFRVVISDQSQHCDVATAPEVHAALRVVQASGRPVEVHKHLPPRGMAEQRQYLLERARAPYVLYLDDDLILEPYVIRNMLKAIREEACGFVGSAVIGLSFLDDVRPHEQDIEFWEGPVEPEVVQPQTPAWQRYRLHNAANLYHLQQRLGLSPERQRKYRVAWVGGCAMYDRKKLLAAGGFGFWQQLPEQHCGEDVLAQQRVMARFGGCGLAPSGVYHLELPTTLPDRRFNAPEVLTARSGDRPEQGRSGDRPEQRQSGDRPEQRRSGDRPEQRQSGDRRELTGAGLKARDGSNGFDRPHNGSAQMDGASSAAQRI